MYGSIHFRSSLQLPLFQLKRKGPLRGGGEGEKCERLALDMGFEPAPISLARPGRSSCPVPSSLSVPVSNLYRQLIGLPAWLGLPTSALLAESLRVLLGPGSIQTIFRAAFVLCIKANEGIALTWEIHGFMHTNASAFQVDELVARHHTLFLSEKATRSEFCLALRGRGHNKCGDSIVRSPKVGQRLLRALRASPGQGETLSPPGAFVCSAPEKVEKFIVGARSARPQ